MTTVPTAPTPSAGAASALAALQVGLFLVPLAVLGLAIGWPASLGLPAARILPLIRDNAAAVLVGYWAYLLVSVAMIPLAFALRQWLAENGVSGWATDALAFAGAAAGVLKTLGIVRWLSVMPVLAEAHGAADEAGRAAVELAYLASNQYAGAVGELLGVQLMSGLWLVGTGAAMRAAGRPLLGAGGVLAGLLLVAACLRTAFPAFGVLQTASVPAALAWFACAAVLLRRPRRA